MQHSTQTDPVPESPALESATRKAFRRLVPLVMIMFVANYIDRVNIGFAKDALEADSGIGAGAYGLGAGLFFITYAIFEVPSNILLERYGAKFWLTRIMISWGLVSAAMMFAHNEWIFYGLRLALGAAEAGFFAGVIFFFTQWFPNRTRGRANAALYSASTIAAVIAGPLSGALLGMHDVLGLRGWQWMFLVEGLAAVLIGVLVWFRLESQPRDAAWLTEQEKDALTAKLRAEEAERLATKQEKAPSRWSMLRDPQMLLFCFVYFAAQLAQYSVTFWLPSFVRDIGGLSEFMIGVISVVPFAVAFFAILAAGRISDATGLRRTVLGSGFVLAAVGLGVAAVTSPVLAVVMLVVATAGFKVAASSFYVIPQQYLVGALAAPGLALINSIGNLGGFVAPTMMGQVQEQTGSVSGGLLVVAACCVVALAGCALLRYVSPSRAATPETAPSTTAG
ncbi:MULTISPECIES: MFS transporter [unclassified Pseudonocardia]|uniref:MFS transporter n=1 Tax=unclassified Pseudonocardia TaxID=2619320 RepID=UPI0001FFED59|nr:MFS transporter [Pseudonocardia sp. Ae707_Ps1]OLM17416.1 Nitrate/nitrite transporter [Pseudonocardia sp. Ae707_Ps1]